MSEDKDIDASTLQQNIKDNTKIDNKDPIVWAHDNNIKIQNTPAFKWALENNQEIGGEKPIVHIALIHYRNNENAFGEYCAQNNIDLYKHISKDYPNKEFMERNTSYEQAYDAYLLHLGKENLPHPNLDELFSRDVQDTAKIIARHMDNSSALKNFCPEALSHRFPLKSLEKIHEIQDKVGELKAADVKKTKYKGDYPVRSQKKPKQEELDLVNGISQEIYAIASKDNKTATYKPKQKPVTEKAIEVGKSVRQHISPSHLVAKASRKILKTVKTALSR